MNFIPLLIGLAVQQVAQREADERRKHLVDAMEAYQSGKAKKSEEAIGQMIASQRPEQRSADLESSIASRAASMEQAVQNTRSSDPAPIAAKPSGDYDKSLESTARTVDQRTKRAIEQLAITGAPDERAFDYALKFGKTASDVDSINTAIRNVGTAYRTSIGNTVPNPYLTTAGGALAAYGASGGSGGGLWGNKKPNASTNVNV